MKNTALIFILIMIFSISAQAQQRNCRGGSEFQGFENGHYYCKSRENMTWWAAFAWCQKQGRRLASLDEACNTIANTTDDTGCSNMKHLGSWAWTANPAGSNAAYGILPGYIATISRNDARLALCY